MPIVLKPLPYSTDSLEPHMSARALELHHGKHHKSYVDKTNAAISGSELANADIETIVRTAKKNIDKKLFNNAAQVWNHEFFWTCLTPRRQDVPPVVARKFDADFGGLEGFKSSFKKEAVEHFASGWAWLVLQNGKLKITSFHDADTPLVYEGVTPLLSCDVWEHAYYVDYFNDRAAFVQAFLDNLVNWDHVASVMTQAASQRAA